MNQVRFASETETYAAVEAAAAVRPASFASEAELLASWEAWDAYTAKIIQLADTASRAAAETAAAAEARAVSGTGSYDDLWCAQRAAYDAARLAGAARNACYSVRWGVRRIQS